MYFIPADPPHPHNDEQTEADIRNARNALWNMGELWWKLDVTQKAIYDFILGNNNKVNVVNASRRLGKSFVLAIIAVELCIKYEKFIVKFIQPEVNMITNNINPEIFEPLFEDAPLELRPKFIPQKNTWLFSNGSRIQLAGTDNKNYNKLRGGSAGFCIVDEAGFCSDLGKIIKSILIPTTLITKGRIVLASTTPDVPDHEFVEIMQNAEAGGTLIRKTIDDAIREQKDFPNPRMTEGILDDILKAYIGGRNNQEFKTEFLCSLIFDSNLSVVSEFSEVEEHVVCLWPRPAFFDRYVSMDVGFDDLTFVLFGYWDSLNSVLYIEREYTINGPELTHRRLATDIRTIENELWTDERTLEFIKPYKRVSDNNKVLLNDLSRDHKLYFQATEKHEKDAYLGKLKVMMSGKQIRIHPSCKQLISHLKYATWNKQRNDYKRVVTNDGNQHHYDGVDALTYLVRNIDFSRNPYPKGWQYIGLGGSENVYRRDSTEKNENETYNKLSQAFSRTRKTSFRK